MYILSKAEILALGHESGNKGALGGSVLVSACKVTVVVVDIRLDDMVDTYDVATVEGEEEITFTLNAINVAALAISPVIVRV